MRASKCRKPALRVKGPQRNRIFHTSKNYLLCTSQAPFSHPHWCMLWVQKGVRLEKQTCPRRKTSTSEWLYGNPELGTWQVAFYDPEEHIQTCFSLWDVQRGHQASKQFCIQAGNWAGGKDHERGVPPNLDQVALQEPSQHIRLETDIAILQQVSPTGQSKILYKLPDYISISKERKCGNQVEVGQLGI